MAVRYSGDVVISILYRRGLYKAKLRAPGFRAYGHLFRSEAGLRVSPTSSEAYDKVAKILLRQAAQAASSQGFKLHLGKILRTFQSPCPYRRP